ncbi:hypothetical protein BA011_40570 (plasmid) [Rhizobium leguminosarum]|uniref:Glycerophosphodiester phosphodiesterase n=1 Tax=Rhizobium leguminosarum TaxID=384 RepID=A0A1B1CKF9_RHILE|nr:hypothetical protein BA011_40570 [Rhizobium leguminosarum]
MKRYLSQKSRFLHGKIQISARDDILTFAAFESQDFRDGMTPSHYLSIGKAPAGSANPTSLGLKKLDIGYGYTADGGRTYPFRGSGVGMMPTLAEVLEAFPDRLFLINVKSNDPDEGSKLATFLNALSPERRAAVMAYGGDRPIAALRTAVPGLKTMSRASLKGCLLRYIAYGWTAAMPDECRSTVVLVPINVAPWLWGWPDRFLNRMDSVGSTAFVVGPYHGGDFSTGMDSVEKLSRLPENYSGGILTNEIEMVAAWLRSRK